MSHPQPAAAHDHGAGLTHCPNCGRLLDGAFCAGCGQKVTGLNPTLHDFFHDLTHELLHVDGKIFRSVRLLLSRPGFLSREWFEGRRARYISPIRLYLVFSVLFFAATALGASFNLELTPEDMADASAAPSVVGSALEADPREVATRFGVWIPRAMFVLVPVFALLVASVTRAAGRNYPQDLYFAFHTHAAIFAFLGLAALLKQVSSDPVDDVLELLGFAYVAWYLVVGLRTGYGGTWRRAIARAAIVSVVYSLALLAAIALVVVIAVAE